MHQTAEVINFNRPVVKADIENGFTRIANELTEALMKNSAKLCGREYQIVHAIIHKTFRFHKKSDWINNAQISEMTGIAQSKISELKKSLINKNILVVEGRNISINTTVSEWANYPNSGKKKVTQKRVEAYPNSGTALPKNGYQFTQKRVTHKKDTLTKDNTTKDIAPKRAKPAKQIPTDFCVTDAMRAWAKEKGVTANIDFETEQFMDYHQARGTTMKDWSKAWQTWMRNTIKFNKSNQQYSKPRNTPENFSEKDYGDIQVRF